MVRPQRQQSGFPRKVFAQDHQLQMWSIWEGPYAGGQIGSAAKSSVLKLTTCSGIFSGSVNTWCDEVLTAQWSWILHAFSPDWKKRVGASISVSSWKWAQVCMPWAAFSTSSLKHFLEFKAVIHLCVIAGNPQSSLRLHNILLKLLHTTVNVLGYLLYTLLAVNFDLRVPCLSPLPPGHKVTSEGHPGLPEWSSVWNCFRSGHLEESWHWDTRFEWSQESLVHTGPGCDRGVLMGQYSWSKTETGCFLCHRADPGEPWRAYLNLPSLRYAALYQYRGADTHWISCLQVLSKG